MSRKYISIVVFLCLLSVGSYAFASAWSFQDNWHYTSTAMQPPATNIADSNWLDPNAWGAQDNGFGLGPRPPDSTVWACIWPLPPGPNIVGDINCSRLSIMPWSWAGAPRIALTLEATAGDVNCGVRIGLADHLNYSSPIDGYPILNMYGGTVTTPGIRNFDANDPYNPDKYDDPCYPWIAGEGLWIGGGASGTGDCYGTINMYGGEIIVPKLTIWYGDVNIFGGLLYHSDNTDSNFFISQSRDRNRINVAGGELRLKGDRRDQVNYMYTRRRGRIVPYDGRGVLNIYYNEDNDWTSVTANTPGSASNPNPANYATSVSVNPTLTWSPDPWVQPTNGHAVYFGLDFNDVNDATPANPLGVYKGRQTATSYIPAGPLDSDTNYYWRIDEYNDANAASPWRGNVWRFRTKGPLSSEPSPASGTVGLPIPLKLSWSSGAYAQDVNGHAIFLGPNEIDVTDSRIGNVLQGVRMYIQSSTIFPLSSLDYNLAPDTNYYWRIDEINDACVSSPWIGEVWMFRNTNYFVVDNFDTYNSFADMNNRWKTGYSNNRRWGCDVPMPPQSYAQLDWEQLLRDGDYTGVMVFGYDNQNGWGGSVYFSEARLEVNKMPDGAKDWTGNGALPDNDKTRSISVSYVGAPGNSSDATYDRMYMAIESNDGNFGMALNANPEAQRTSVWEQWEVNFTDLNSPRVKMNNIDYFYLGFGLRCNSGTVGGTGTVMFDDIRLYQRHCVPEYGPTADFTDDCVVNLADVDVMSEQWLSDSTETDIYVDGIVNFRDFAVLASQWLTEKLWPNP